MAKSIQAGKFNRTNNPNRELVAAQRHEIFSHATRMDKTNAGTTKRGGKSATSKPGQRTTQSKAKNG